MKGFIKSRRFRYGGTALILTALVIAAVIIFNVIFAVLAARYQWMYADMNSTAVYDVSEDCRDYIAKWVIPRVDEVNGEKAAIGKEKQKIEIVFCSEKEKIEQVQAQKYILDAFYRLSEDFPGYIDIGFINIWEQPSLAREYGATAETDVVCLFDGRCETMTLPDFYLYSVSGGSSAIGYNGDKIIASCLMRVTQENTPVCYFTANHGESVDDYELIRTVVESGYAAEFIDLSSEEIPEDCSLLVTFEPKQDFLVTDGVSGVSEIDKLDSYMNNGGKYMIFLSADTFASGERVNLEGFLKEWGIVYMHEKSEVEEGIENCYLVKDASNSLTVDGYTVLAENANVGLGAEIMKGLPAKNAFSNSTYIGFAEGFVGDGEGNLSANVGGKKRVISPLMQSFGSAEAWAGGRAVARASEEPFALMTVTAQDCGDGETAYLVASASSDFATEEFMQSIALGNSRSLMGIIRYMGKENAPAELSYKPFANTDITALTVKNANIITVLLTAIPAVACLGVGTVVLVRRKNS